MADEAQQRQIEEFCKVTGTNSSRARLYLEASGWDTSIAMSSYYEESDEIANEEEEEEDETATYFAGPAREQKSKPVTSSSSSRIATLASLAHEEVPDEEEGQAFYAGGSERSGQQVLGPGKRKGPQIVEEMFKAARSHGAEVVDPSENRRGSAQLKAFKGTGYVLGNTADNTEMVNNAGPEESNGSIDICLRAWRTGFTIDDGPLREYSDPSNKSFLDSIRRGEIPRELVSKARGGEINLNIEDHSQEDYVPAKASLQAFSGAGYRLGSPTPPVAGTRSHEDSKKNETDAQRALNVDDSQPVATIQIRLADGSRLSLKLNHSHTVGDIRRYLVLARPEYSASVFSLMTSYPPKELVDDNATIAEENLINSLLVQKLK